MARYQTTPHSHPWILVLGLLLGTLSGISIMTIRQEPPGPAAATVSAAPSEDAAPYALPNATTPGAILTGDKTLVCKPGYTKTVRAALTAAEQAQANTAYHWQYAPGAQEYDHLIPLELGGANGLVNIWPQPITEARVKDRLENVLHTKVCGGQLGLASAQQCIRVDWAACARKYGAL